MKLTHTIILLTAVILNQFAFSQELSSVTKTLGGSSNDRGQSIFKNQHGTFTLAAEANFNDKSCSSNMEKNWIIEITSKLEELNQISFTRSMNDIKQTSDGGYIMAGVTGWSYSENYYIIKRDSLGAIEWLRNIGGSKRDIAFSIEQTADAGYIVAGESNSNDGHVSGNNGGYDYWVVKLDKNGAIHWQNCIGGADDERNAVKITQTSDGKYILAGITLSDFDNKKNKFGLSDMWIVRLDGKGNIEWHSSYGGSNNDIARDIIPEGDEGYTVFGSTASEDGDVSGNHGSFDMWLIKIDTAGNLLWQNCYGGSWNENAYDFTKSEDGGYLLAGMTQSEDSGDVTGSYDKEDGWIVKTNANGAFEYSKCIGGDESERFFGITTTSNNEFIAVGSTASNNGDIPHHYGGEDILITRFCYVTPVSVAITDPSYCYQTSLIASEGYTSYSWNTGDSTRSIQVDSGGIYQVTAYNYEGCPTHKEVVVPEPAQPYDSLNICMVSYDSNEKHNVVLYEPLLDDGIDSVIIYRKADSVKYKRIGANSINVPGIYIDEESNPNDTRYQYKLAIKDTCNKISKKCPSHETMKLEADATNHKEIKLGWNAYHGFNYTGFNIYRSTNGEDFDLLANISGNPTTFTDSNPPEGEKWYQIRVEISDPCNTGLESFHFASSNIVYVNPLAINPEKLRNHISIYPNPVGDRMKIKKGSTSRALDIKIFNQYGNRVKAINMRSAAKEISIPTRGLPAGVYYIQANRYFVKRIVKVR